MHSDAKVEAFRWKMFLLCFEWKPSVRSGSGSSKNPVY
jgi:hypothetical protein